MSDPNTTAAQPDAQFDVAVEIRPAGGLSRWFDQRRQELPAWTASLFLHLALIVSIPALGPTPTAVDQDQSPLLDSVLSNAVDWQRDAEAGQGLAGDTAGAYTLQAAFRSSSPKPKPSRTAGQQDQLAMDPASSAKQADRGRPRESSKAVARLDAQIEYVQNRLTRLTAKLSRQTSPRTQEGEAESLRDEQSQAGHNQNVGRDSFTPQGVGLAQGSEAPDGHDDRALSGGRGKHGRQALGEGTRSRSPPLPLITYAGDNRDNLWIWRRRRAELYRQQKQREELEARRRLEQIEQRWAAGEIAILNEELKVLQRKRELLVDTPTGLESTDEPGDIVLVNKSSAGFYNDALGRRLDGTAWNPAIAAGRYFTKIRSPDLSAVSEVLGGWLSQKPPTGRWLMMAPVPDVWNPRQESAVVYQVQNNSAQKLELLGTFAARDAGVFIWVNGEFRLATGYGSGSFKLTRTSLGTIGPGTHYVQILRESDARAPRLEVRLVGRSIKR